MIIVVNASVVLKWLVEEPDSAAAMNWLQAEHVLVAPAHCFGEVGQALCRQVRLKGLGREQALQALGFLRQYVSTMPLADLLDGAADIALSMGIAFYDALYVALAQRHGTFVVSADRKLMTAVAGSEWRNRVVDVASEPPR